MYRIIKSIVLSTVIVGVSLSVSATTMESRLNRIADAYLSHELFRGDILVAQKGKILMTNASQSNHQIKRYEIGSIAKTFTSVLAYKLHEKGVLDFDAPVKIYLESLQDSPVGQVTIKELLAHESGLPRDYIVRSQRESHQAMTAKQRLQVMRQLEVARHKQKRYSNTGYALLALIIEAVVNKAFEDVLFDEITAPLGLTDTGVINAKSLPTLVLGHNRLLDKTITIPSRLQNYAIGHGAMYSTVVDLAGIFTCIEPWKNTVTGQC